jgi:hypothetical protein
LHFSMSTIPYISIHWIIDAMDITLNLCDICEVIYQFTILPNVKLMLRKAWVFFNLYLDQEC